MPKQNGQNCINLQHKNSVAIPLSVPYQTFAHAMLVMADVRSLDLIGLPDTLTIAFPAIFSRHLKPHALVYMVRRDGLKNLMVFRCTDQEPYVLPLVPFKCRE